MDNTHQPTPTPTRMAVVSPRQVDISFWNQRLTRSEQTIQSLAMRLARDGFDPTRPIKCHLDPDLPDHYRAFAGGTRLLAAKRANLDVVHIAIYEGLTEQQIIQSSDKDNEDDEAHTLVCVVDRWKWCPTLQGLGWSQADIAAAKNVKERSVYYWLQYANFPQSILDQFCTKDFLKESHARELANFAQFANLASFVTTELMMLEVIELAITKAGRGEGPTADQFRKLVEMYNTFLAKAQERYDQIANQRWQTEFVGRLAEANARSVAEVDRVYTGLAREIEREARRSAQAAQDALAEQQRLVQEAAAEQQRRTLEAQRAETYQAILANLMLGDVPANCCQVHLLALDWPSLMPLMGKNTMGTRITGGMPRPGTPQWRMMMVKRLWKCWRQFSRWSTKKWPTMRFCFCGRGYLVRGISQGGSGGRIH